MKEVQETDMARRTKYDCGFWFAKKKHPILSLGLTLGGTLAMYGFGRLVAEGAEHIPYLNEWIPAAINYFSGIDVSGNIDGLMGLLGGLYGLNESGIKINRETLELEEVVLTPVHLTKKDLSGFADYFNHKK